MSLLRAQTLSCVLVALVVLGTPGVAVATLGPTAATPDAVATPDAAIDSGPWPTSPMARGPLITEEHTFERGEDNGTVRLTLAYDLPTGVTEFRVRLPDVAGPSVSVADIEGFERQDETAFAWTRSTSTPTLTLRLQVATEEVSTENRGVERDGWAFATVPPTGFGVQYTGTQPELVSTTTVDGPGYATDRMAFMGSYDTVEVAQGDEAVRFVVGNGTVEGNLSAAQAFLDRAVGRFDFGVRRDRLVVFVLPYAGRVPGDGEATVTGEAFGDAFWVTADATTVEGPENAFAHEYVHSRLTDVGNGSAAWLTEATAEYYGALATLNVGGTSYERFYRATTAEGFAPNETAVTLADPATWRGTLGDYEKGAHVLAALDVEIRERTDGERTLYDVFVTTRSFDDYAAFRAAVVETTGDESLGPWLDRYVTTDALPPLPNDPARYVHGPGLDPDDDGLTSGAELSATPPTNPFAADTDGDTVPDARERETGTNPTKADTDGDGTNDALDAYPTDPAVQRTTPATGTQQTRTLAASPSAVLSETGTPPAVSDATERAPTRTETPGFGVGAAAVALGIIGVLVGTRRRARR